MNSSFEVERVCIHNFEIIITLFSCGPECAHCKPDVDFLCQDLQLMLQVVPRLGAYLAQCFVCALFVQIFYLNFCFLSKLVSLVVPTVGTSLGDLLYIYFLPQDVNHPIWVFASRTGEMALDHSIIGLPDRGMILSTTFYRYR